MYLDNLRCTHQINHKNIPRAKYFTQDLIKKIIAADKTKDDQGKVTFGRLPVSHSNYCPPFLYGIPFVNGFFLPVTFSILCVQLRNIDDTCYYMPDNFIPNMPANIEPVPPIQFPIQFPSLLTEVGRVVHVTVVSGTKRKLLKQAFAQFDINSKKAMTSINKGHLMLRSSHAQVIEKVRSILEVPSDSEGRGHQLSDANSIGKWLLQTLIKHAATYMFPLICILFFRTWY